MMNRHAYQDPLEETLENPDLPPLSPVHVPHARGVAAASRRGLRITLTLSVVTLLLAAVALRFVG